MNNCGLYIHIPFCKSKCNYCDFYSVCGDAPLKESYYNALIRNIEKLSEIYSVKKFDSLFIGGGTPSVMGERLAKIIYKATESFNFEINSEISVEVNPESVTDTLSISLFNAGVNRISMGVQTFDKEQLKILGRIHNNEDVYNAVNSFTKNGISNFNIDLMFSLPITDRFSDTVSLWENSLNTALDFNPKHLSAYSLTLEENTLLYKNMNNYYFPTEQQEEDMYSFLCEKMKKGGYSHYEISNYAIPGYECKHNLKYWEHKEYLGIGPGAHSFINGKRYCVPCDIYSYSSGNTSMEEYENIDEVESVYERLITGLRLSKGINITDFSNYYNTDKITSYAQKLQENGLSILNNQRFSLTEKGFRVSNTIINQLDNYRKF